MDEGLSFSDIFDEDIPYEQKPPEMLKPMEEDDFSIQTKDKFGGLWENNLLTEIHLQDLYHATHEFQLLGMLEDGAIKLAFVGGTQADEFYNKGYPFFLSTMRQKYGNYAHDIGGENVGNKYNVIIHLDGTALTAAGYKHFPIDFWSRGPQYSEQEERIVSNKDEIKPLKKFVKGIHVYIPKDLKHPFIIDALHKISDLAPEKGVPVYFYPSDALGYFRSHRTERAVKDVDQILPPAEFSKDDLEHLEWRKKNASRPRDSYLDSFMRIYNGDYSQTDIFPDKNVLNWLRYYTNDSYSQLFCSAHNEKTRHPAVFREIVAAMKKEGVKNFKDLITLVMNRERERLRRENDVKEIEKLNESEELHIGDKEYDYDSQYAFALFEIYPTFWVYSQTKNGRSKFYSNNPKLEEELEQFNDKYKVHVHQRLWMMLDKIKISAGIPDVDYAKGSKKNTTSGRIWGIQGKIYVSFWDKLSVVRPIFDKAEEILKDIKVEGKVIDAKTALYIFGGATTDEDVMTYDEVKGKETKDIQTDDDVLLQKLIHLSPEVKKGLLNVGSDRMQYYADRLGISIVQLKQLMGSLDEGDNIIGEIINQDQLKSISLFLGISDEELKKWIEKTDPTPTQSFSVWLLRGLKNKDFRFEDSVRIKPLLNRFIQLRLARQIDDIMKFSRIHDLETKIEQLVGIGSKRQGFSGVDPTKLPGVKVIENRGNIVFFAVSNPESLALMGEGTKWCTRKSFPDCQARSYLEEFSYLIIVYKDGKPFIQYSPDFSQIMDVNDQEIENIQSIIKLTKTYKNIDAKLIYYWHRLYPNEDKSELKNILPFEYHKEDKSNVILKKYFGYGGDVIIPSMIDGLPVTSIGVGTFAYCTSLTSVTIPNSVISIRDSVFNRCTSLTNVTIGNSVTNIGNQMFANCGRLASITIPDSVTKIGGAAFYNCTDLTNVNLGNGVNSIGFAAFSYCTSLSNVTIGNSVTTIGHSAFSDCTSLTNVTIPNSVTSIGEGAFYECTSLTGVYFQGNAPSLGSYAFDGDNIATVFYLPGKAGWGMWYGNRPTKMLKQTINEVESAIHPNTKQLIGHVYADSIFTLHDGGLIVGMQELPSKMIFFSNSDAVEKALNIFDFQKFIPPGEDRDLQLTHTHLQRLTHSAISRAKILPIDVTRKGKIAGRIWKFDDTNGVSVIGFWQSINEVRQNWKQLLWIFEKLKVDYRIAQYTFNNKISRKYTYLDIVGKISVPEVDKKEMELMRLLHTSPEIKKKLIGMESDQLKDYADRVNIPLIKLKQMLGSMDETATE